jgi:hypothetical protein
MRLCPCHSDVNLFSYGEGIVDFDAEILDGALDLPRSQQQLLGVTCQIMIESRGRDRIERPNDDAKSSKTGPVI